MQKGTDRVNVKEYPGKKKQRPRKYDANEEYHLPNQRYRNNKTKRKILVDKDQVGSISEKESDELPKYEIKNIKIYKGAPLKPKDLTKNTKKTRKEPQIKHKSSLKSYQVNHQQQHVKIIKRETGKSKMKNKPTKEGKWKIIEKSPKFMESQYVNTTFIDETIEDIRKTKFVKRLFLKENKIDDNGITRLMTFLKNNTEGIFIKNMYFYRNEISDIGAEKIAEYLNHTSCLPNEIHLSHNRITIKGAKKIFRAVKNRGYPIKRIINGKEKFLPIWLRLEWNLINNDAIDSVLKGMGLTYCKAYNRNTCSPISCNCKEIPVLHLYVIHLQYKPVEESMLLNNTRTKARRGRNNKPKMDNQPIEDQSSSASPEDGIPTLLFLDTNAVINMMDFPVPILKKKKQAARYFTWKNLIEKAQKNQFGYSCFDGDGDKVCLLLTNTVMQEIDHQKKKTLYLRKYVVDQLQSEMGYLSQAATLKFLEILGSHQGERLIKEKSQEIIDMAHLNNPNLANDISLLNVALFWNSEIGNTGTVILITGDLGCLKMAKEHNLPATTLLELDNNIRRYMNEPWTAKMIRKCIPTATIGSGGALGDPLTHKSISIYQELRLALHLTNCFLSGFHKVTMEFTIPDNLKSTSVELYGDFGLDKTQFVMSKRKRTNGIGISIVGQNLTENEIVEEYTNVIINEDEDEIEKMKTTIEEDIELEDEDENEDEDEDTTIHDDNDYKDIDDDDDDDDSDTKEDNDNDNDNITNNDKDVVDDDNEVDVDDDNESDNNNDIGDNDNEVEEDIDGDNEDVKNEGINKKYKSEDYDLCNNKNTSLVNVDNDNGDKVIEVIEVNKVNSGNVDNVTNTSKEVSEKSEIDQEWWIQLELSPRTYFFKFLCDGVTWSINPNLPIVSDQYGNTSNLFVVPAPTNLGNTVEEAKLAIQRWKEALSVLPTFLKKNDIGS